MIKQLLMDKLWTTGWNRQQQQMAPLSRINRMIESFIDGLSTIPFILQTWAVTQINVNSKVFECVL